MSTKSVNTDAAQVQPAGNAELGDVLQGMFRKLDGVDHNQPGYHHASGWNAALRQVMDVLRAQTFSTQAQPDAIRHEHDWVQGPYITDTVGSGWCVRIDGTNIFADLNQYGCKGRVTFQIARGLPSKEEAEKALTEWLGKYITTQQPVSGADGLTDAAIEMLAKQYDCHNAPGFKGFARAVAECVTMDDAQAPRVAQLTHPKHGTMQINTDILWEVANREAGEGTFIDAAGTVWSRPTAYAYAMVCKARDKWQAKAEEARDSALGEAAQALAYRRGLLISQNIVNDIQEGVALYDICIDAVLSLQQNATSTAPDKPKRATPMGELVLQLFDALDEAMRLDKSPSAWKHNPAGTPAQRMEAWQKVHKLRAEIKEFIG